MTSFVSAKSTSGLRSTRARSGVAASSSARTPTRDPLNARPIGVRTASTITASGIEVLLDWSVVPPAVALHGDVFHTGVALAGAFLERHLDPPSSPSWVRLAAPQA